MSLLLEALKKAEKAKEEAQRRAKGGDDATADPDATVVDSGRHVTTRAELPDISAPLEILSEDIRPKAAAGPSAATLSLVDEPPPAPEPKAPPRPARASASAPAADAEKPQRATAQKVFEAKFKEPNPKLPFYITMGTLGAFAVGTAIYFWMQLRPPPPLVNPNPPAGAAEKQVAGAEQKPAAVSDSGKNQAPAAQPALPGLPGAPAAQAPAAAAAPSAAAAAPASAPSPAAATASAPPAAAAPGAAAPKPAAPARSAARSGASPRPAAAKEDGLTVNRGGSQINPRVAAGYTAYQASDLTTARNEYQQALREEPGNRDALLGLAAVEMRAQRYDLADQYYQRLLQADPRDPHAQAGMLALRSQQIDPVQAESRVKSLLAADKEANVLYFTLGNQYAQQRRWPEAQQAYFKAYAADPGNPDFAFNLAVSLDQVRQPKLALEYYQRALALAEKRAANFSMDLARARVQQLSR